MIKKEIENREDIELLVNEFYAKVQKDELIGYIFEDVAKVNWQEHLPKMYDFWETILFTVPKYRGNPMHAHKRVDEMERIEKVHFDRWVALFVETLDTYFKGDRAEMAQRVAESNSSIILNKLKYYRGESHL